MTVLFAFVLKIHNNNYDEVENLLLENLTEREKSLGDNYPIVMSSLGALAQFYDNNKKVEQAQYYHESCLDQRIIVL